MPENNSLPSAGVADTESHAKPVSMQIELAPSARRVIDNIKDDTGVSKIQATSRFLEFCATLPREVQLEILHRRGDPLGLLVRLKMAELSAAGSANGGPVESVEQALPIIRLLLDRIEQDHVRIQRLLGQRLTSERAKAEHSKKGK